MSAIGALKFVGALVAAGAVIFALRLLILALSAWLERRAEAKSLASVPFPDDGEPPELICIPGGRRGRMPYRGRR